MSTPLNHRASHERQFTPIDYTPPAIDDSHPRPVATIAEPLASNYLSTQSLPPSHLMAPAYPRHLPLTVPPLLHAFAARPHRYLPRIRIPL